MSIIPRLFVLVLFLCWGASLLAKSDYAVLKLCFEKNGAPFLISTKDKKIAEKEGFQQVKETDFWMRRMKVTLDYNQIFSFKAVSDSCIAISRIPAGSHTIGVDFKAAAYTPFVTVGSVTRKFKADLLFDAVLSVEEGPTVPVEIRQSEARVLLYETIENQPVPACEKSCRIPTDIPVYFMARPEDDKVECPVDFELIVGHLREKNLGCYDGERITEMLKTFVKENGIKCRVHLEYAFFRAYGEGCIVTLEPDPSGLRPKDPEIRLVPLEKQKLRYYLQIGDGEKKLYTFSSADKKGEVVVPQKGQPIVLVEVREQ